MRMFESCFRHFKRKKKYSYIVNETTMIAQVDKKTPIKIAGYLEKRSKMRVVCRWKKLWFVLEGRLLLYYKSQLEYLSLSPCRGTVNLGLAASVSPGKSNEIIVSTRSNTVSLRALNRSEYDIWLQALMDAMHLPNTNHTMCCTKPVRHFRYSTGGLEDQKGRTYGDYMMNHAHTLSGRLSPVIQTSYEGTERRKQSGPIDLKHEKLARRFSKITASDTTIPDNFNNTSKNSLKMNLLRRSVSVEDEVNRYNENIYETVDSHKYRAKYPRRVMRSDSDCLMMRERVYRPPVFRSEQRIKSVYDSNNLKDNDVFFDRIDKCSSPDNKLARMKFNPSCLLEKKKDIKSDTDLAIRKHEDYHYGSCNVIYRPSEYRHLLSSGDPFDYSDYSRSSGFVRSSEILHHSASGKMSRKPKRSNSILRHFLRNKPDICSPLMKKNSVRRRSLSFLKRIWKRKETKYDDDISFNTEEDMQEIHHLHSDMASSSTYSAVEMSMEYEAPLPEPPPDYGQFSDVEELSVPELPPRVARGPTPWDDNPTNEDPPDQPPELPLKNKKRTRGSTLDFLFQDGWDPGLRRLFNETEECNHKDLGEIMAQLADISSAPLKYTNSKEDIKKVEDPDYDIPRPHDSLLLDVQNISSPPDSMQPTNFFSHFEDSLDIPQPRDKYDEFNMAPDSLECDPWSLSESESTYDSWSTQSQIRRKTIVTSTYGTNQETYFKDTLKLSHNSKDYINIKNGFIQLHT